MCITKNMNADLLQLCISRGVAILPHAYYAFIDILNDMEHKNTLCLVPLSRLELFTHKVDPTNILTKKDNKVRRIC